MNKLITDIKNVRDFSRIIMPYKTYIRFMEYLIVVSKNKFLCYASELIDDDESPGQFYKLHLYHKNPIDKKDGVKTQKSIHNEKIQNQMDGERLESIKHIEDGEICIGIMEKLGNHLDRFKIVNNSISSLVYGRQIYFLRTFIKSLRYLEDCIRSNVINGELKEAIEKILEIVEEYLLPIDYKDHKITLNQKTSVMKIKKHTIRKGKSLIDTTQSMIECLCNIINYCQQDKLVGSEERGLIKIDTQQIFYIYGRYRSLFMEKNEMIDLITDIQHHCQKENSFRGGILYISKNLERIIGDYKNRENLLYTNLFGRKEYEMSFRPISRRIVTQICSKNNDSIAMDNNDTNLFEYPSIEEIYIASTFLYNNKSLTYTLVKNKTKKHIETYREKKEKGWGLYTKRFTEMIDQKCKNYDLPVIFYCMRYHHMRKCHESETTEIEKCVCSFEQRNATITNPHTNNYRVKNVIDRRIDIFNHEPVEEWIFMENLRSKYSVDFLILSEKNYTKIKHILALDEKKKYNDTLDDGCLMNLEETVKEKKKTSNSSSGTFLFTKRINKGEADNKIKATSKTITLERNNLNIFSDKNKKKNIDWGSRIDRQKFFIFSEIQLTIIEFEGSVMHGAKISSITEKNRNSKDTTDLVTHFFGSDFGEISSGKKKIQFDDSESCLLNFYRITGRDNLGNSNNNVENKKLKNGIINNITNFILDSDFNSIGKPEIANKFDSDKSRTGKKEDKYTKILPKKIKEGSISNKEIRLIIDPNPLDPSNPLVTINFKKRKIKNRKRSRNENQICTIQERDQIIRLKTRKSSKKKQKLKK